MKKNSRSVDVSIIIVNFNGKKWLDDCIKSIYKNQIKSLEIVFVDNQSIDGSDRMIEEKYPLVSVIRNNKNLGFGKANNIGAKSATGKYLVFLNTDTKLHSNCLQELLSKMEEEKIDLAGPKILDFSGHDYYKGRKLTLDIIGSLSWGKKTTMIEGCCLVMKKTVFEKLGGFDEDFFMYSEDLDLCWRAWLYGLKVGLINSAVIDHYGGGSSLPTMIGKEKHIVPENRRYETEKNTIKMMIKNASVSHLLLALPIMISLIVGESFLYLITGQYKSSTFIFKAVKWNILNIKKTLKQRSIIQKRKNRSTIWPHVSKKITKFTVFMLIGIPKIKNND